MNLLYILLGIRISCYIFLSWLGVKHGSFLVVLVALIASAAAALNTLGYHEQALLVSQPFAVLLTVTIISLMRRKH